MMVMMNPTKANNNFRSYFLLFLWGFLLMEVGLGQSQTSEIKVGVVLDLQTTFSKICLTSINMSLTDFYEDHPNYRTRIVLHVRDSMQDTVQASAADALEDVKVNRSVISPEANDDQILMELYKLMTMQTRVFIVHMASSLGFRVLQKAREIGMMEKGYVWLLTNEMTHMMRHSNHDLTLETMEGVLGVRSHVPKTKVLQDFGWRWKRKFMKENPSMGNDVNLNVFALWAYDSVTALAMAVEKISLENLRYDNVSASTNNKIELGSLGVSRYGPSLLKALSDVRFNGLAGGFSLIDGQLKSSTFEIINIVGNEERVIGSWIPSNRLVNANSNKTVSFSGERLGPVIWPGKSKDILKGWEIPTNGEKLRVGVPVKKGFLNILGKKIDPISNVITPMGYSIDIFEAALKKLPYSVIPQYFPFEPPDDNYDDLVYQVYNGSWDAAVGDITITANRSSYVDFTLPYTESGVSMIYIRNENKNKNTWVFLKPWSLDLWVTTACFFVFIGFIVLILEHRVNTNFRGPLHHQIGTSFWFSFSTMNFAHREKVVSNLARFVVVVWCFVVLVLTQSYTANLTSFLTVQRFGPAVRNWKDLIGESVGYHQGSFVFDFLKNLGFPESQLKPFGSAEECDQLLSKGDIAAAFDEVTYLKVIISQFCSKYAMVEPFVKTPGFGFVFTKNSPLTGDVSRAILRVTEGDEMEHIEKKLLRMQSDCPNTDFSSNGLSLSSFWGLFLIAGLASFLALLVFVASFLYEHRHTLYDDSGYSFWRKLFRIYDEKDIKSHMFKASVVHNVSSPITQCISSPSTVQITPMPLSPSQNREIVPIRVSFIQSEDLSTLQPEQDINEESDINSEGQ